MPPLKLLGHSWHISSDDLVLPAWVGVAFHGTWTALIAAELAIVGLPDDCEARQLASSCVVWLLVSFGLTTLLQGVVAGISMRGAMLEEHKRAAMPGAMCCLLLAYCLEAAALIYATVVNFAVLRDGFNTCHTAEELARTRISELTLHRWFIGTTWGMLAVILGLLALLYNLYPDRGLESWEKRVNCLSYVMCCRQALTADASDGSTPESSASTVVRLARVFGDLFYPLNFSFTDTVAAITLVGITHRSSAHGHGSSSHNHALIAAAGAGVLGPAKHDATPGATALLEAAAALADAQAAAAGPATGATCALAQSVSKSAGQAQAGEAAGLEQLPTAMASNGPVCLQQQQFMTTVGTAGPAAAVASKDALCSQGDTAVVGAGAGSGQSSPPPAPHSSRGAAQGSLMRSSSPALQEPPAVPFLRSVSASSAWEVAVRQGSTLALAPGHRLAPSSAAAAAATMAGQGVGGSLGDDARSTAGVALPARTQSTTEPSAAAAAAAGHMPPPLRAGQRSVSWAGASFAEQPFLGRSSEQGAAAGKHPALDAAAPAGAFSCGKVPLGALDCLAEGIAEGMELSVTSSHMLGQVQSLLSPLQSNDIAAADARVLTPVAGTAAAGDTVGAAAADALAAGSAAQPAAAVGGGGASAAATSRAPALLTGAYQHQHQQALAAGAAQAALAVGAAEGLAAQLQDAAVAGAAAAEGALEVASAVMSDGQLVPLELLEEALHWHAYANAIYGWPMFLWSHRYRVLRCCRLCCGGCCPGVRDMDRSSAGGGGGMYVQHGGGASGYPAVHGSSKAASGRGSSGHGGKGSSPEPPVLMLSAVDSDSESPSSTIAGAGDAAPQGRRRQLAGPVAEAVEDVPSNPSNSQQQGQTQGQQQVGSSGGLPAAAVQALDVEQGGGISRTQQQQQQMALVAAAPGSSRASRDGAANGEEAAGAVGSSVAHNSQSQWIQPGGNVWLLQGLADALGIGRDSASPPDAAAAAAVSPASSSAAAKAAAAAAAGSRGSAGGSAGGASKGPLASAAGGLRPDGGVCGCMCGGKWGESHVPKMAPLTASQRLTNEAIMQTANIPAADLLYVNYNNLVEGLLPYSVALDAAQRCVVVAIRGSLSVEDCVTDILYDPAPLDADWLLQPAAADVAAGLPDGLSHYMQQTCQGEAAAMAAQLADQELLQGLQHQQPPLLLGAAHNGIDQAAGGDAAAAAEAAADGGELSSGLGGSLPGASSGSFSRSIKASPFATAAAAASAAARRSSTGMVGEDSGAGSAATGYPKEQQPPPQQQQPPQPEASLARMPSVPAAQAAAAAAAAASRVPLAAPAAAPAAAAAAAGAGRPLHRQWSVNVATFQQQQPGARLSEQRSFLQRRTGGAPQRQQQVGGNLTPDHHQQQQQQQLLTSRPSVLEGALSVLLGPWRRRTASDTGGQQQQQQAAPASDAALAAAEEGTHLPRPAHGPFGTAAAAAAAAGAGAGAGSHRFGRSRAGSIEGVGEPGSGSNTPRKLFKTMSLNLATAFGGGHRQGASVGQAAGRGRRLAATDSCRRLDSGRQQSSLQSYASEMIPSGSTTRRSSTDVWSQNQTRRTTAADRALGAARAGHRYAPLTSPATDQSAAAAAAHQRSFLHQQQQQHRQSQLSSLHSIRSTAPASAEGSLSAASVSGPYAGPGAGLGGAAAAAEPGLPAAGAAGDGGGGEPAQQQAASQGRASGAASSSAAAAAGGGAGGSGASSPQQGSPLAGRSRRTIFNQLPRIDSATAAMLRPESLQQLSSAASVPAHFMAQQQQQQQLALLQQHAGTEHARHSEEGLITSAGARGGTGPRSLRATTSGVRQWGRRFMDQLSPSQQQQQQQHLADGGPTDWSLLHNAAPMVPSRTAAVKPQPSLAPAAAAATAAAGGPRLSMSYSARPASITSATRLATSFSLGPNARPPPVAASLAGVLTESTAVCGSTSGASEGTNTTAATGAAAASAGDGAPDTPLAHDVSPFMLHDPGQLGITAGAAAGGMLQPLVDAGTSEGAESAFAAAMVTEEAAFAAEGDAEEAEEAAAAAAAAAADAAAAAAQAAAAEETPDTGAAGAQWFAHEGILNCARAIRDDLDRLGLLDQLLLGSSSAVVPFTAAAAKAAQQQQEGHGQQEGQGLGSVPTDPSDSSAGKGLDPDAAGIAGAGIAGGVIGPEGRFLSSSELPDCRGWTLVVTGHSLGAGVAALLALHYRARYEAVRAWCFAPPGGLMSPAAAVSLKDICYSLVSAKDMVPRMSLWTIERLRDEMMICALRCKVPKYKLLLGAAFGKVWEEHEVLKPLEELSEAEVACFQAYRRSVVEERSLDPLRVRIAREFVPPGEVLWLERCKELQPRLRMAHNSNNSLAPAADAAAAAPKEALAIDISSDTTAATTAAAALAAHGPGGTYGTAVIATAAAAPSAFAAAAAAADVPDPAAAQGTTTAAAAAGSSPTPRGAAAFSRSLAKSSMIRTGSAALEAAAVAMAGKRLVSRLQPHWSDGLGIIVGGMVVSRNMFADHVPDKQLAQLKRLVRQLRRQQALGQPLPAGIAPVVVAQAPLQQQGMSRRLAQ